MGKDDLITLPDDCDFNSFRLNGRPLASAARHKPSGELHGSLTGFFVDQPDYELVWVHPSAVAAARLLLERRGSSQAGDLLCH